MDIIGKSVALRPLTRELCHEIYKSYHLANDSVKGKGYGTEAEKPMIQYAFEQLGLNTVHGDSVLRNTRSQHIMKKLGFQYVCEDEIFKYYELKKNNWL